MSQVSQDESVSSISSLDRGVSRGDRIREAIGVLYDKQFHILLNLTAAYYVLVSLRDIVSTEPEAERLLWADIAVLGMLAVLSLFKRYNIVDRGNVYLTPIPVAVAMIANGYLHIFVSGQPMELVKGILMIFAFSVVSLLPWIFWFLTMTALACYIIASIWILGAESGPVLILGAGSAMLAYAAFTTRYNTVLNQIDLAFLNEERAEDLAQLSATKDQFIANVSHELRTPLAGLLGMVNLLDEHGLSAEQKQHLAAAKSSANTLGALIGDLLDISSLEAGKLRLNNASFDFDEMAKQVIAAVEVHASSNVELIYKGPAQGLPRLVGDASRLSQILFNLVGNALKFTDKGSVSLTIDVQKTDDGLTLRCAVKDTGIGIPADRLEHLFDRFEQVDSSRTRGRAGSGLGLAIASELVQLMGGHLQVESTLGEGSKFWFDVTLPASEDKGLGREGGTAPAADETQAALEYPLSILIVEDNPVIQLLVRKLVNRPAWTTKLVSDGLQAVEAAGAEKFDIILMDIQMPVMDGETAAKEIKANPGPNAETPIFALTANCQESDVARYKIAGFEGLIAKPITNSEFYGVLADVCYQKVKGSSAG